MLKLFNKNFFKFSLGFLAIILASLAFMIAVSAYAATVSKIVFTSEERSVEVNQISEGLTVQTQDSSGSSIQTPETLDLEFFSTSPTGEFLSSTGNAATKTMNKNTSNRTFYYRDSSGGVFTITVKATGRESGNTFETSQQIAVGASLSSSQGETLGASGEISNLSATTGAASPSYSALDGKLEVVAGQDRLTSPGSPLNFQAQIKKNSSSNSSVKFSWSFGDGSVGDGALVSHTYKYPGEYALVLNANAGNTFASSRLKVLVVQPEITILDQGKHVEISNNSKYELNLFKWKLVAEKKGFIFQPDTIILPKSKIKVDKNLLTMKGEVDGGVVLKNSLGESVASTNSLLEVEKMALDLVNAKTEVSKIIDLAIATGAVKESYPKATPKVALKSEVEIEKTEKVESAEETVVTGEVLGDGATVLGSEILYEAESEGFATKLTKFIKRLFSK